MHMSRYRVISFNKNLQFCINRPTNFKLFRSLKDPLLSFPKLPSALSHGSPAKAHTSLSRTGHRHSPLVPLSPLSLQLEQLLSIHHPSCQPLLPRYKSSFPSLMKLLLATQIPSQLSLPSTWTQPRAGHLHPKLSAGYCHV